MYWNRLDLEKYLYSVGRLDIHHYESPSGIQNKQLLIQHVTCLELKINSPIPEQLCMRTAAIQNYLAFETTIFSEK